MAVVSLVNRAAEVAREHGALQCRGLAAGELLVHVAVASGGRSPPARRVASGLLLPVLGLRSADRCVAGWR